MVKAHEEQLARTNIPQEHWQVVSIWQLEEHLPYASELDPSPTLDARSRARASNDAIAGT